MDARELEPDYSKVHHYLGYQKGVPEDEVRYVVKQCVEDLASQTRLKSVARHFPLKFLDGNRFLIGDMELESRALLKNMCGCDEAYLIAVTIGFAMDRLAVRVMAIGRMSHAVTYQAVDAVLIESYCDTLNWKLKGEAAAEGKSLRPCFSSSYGDLPLATQPELFRVLEAQKHIGITLTGSLLIMSARSVTALIGVSPGGSHCVLQGCESCSEANCSFRR